MEKMETPVVPSDTGLNELVYDPAEDSFLLIDALEDDLPKTFANQGKSDVLFALEVGCGSGLISVAIAKSSNLLGVMPCVFAADINPNACQLTEKTGTTNKVESGSLHTLLLDGTRFQRNPFRIQFDLIVCNPPYVPILDGENNEDEQSGMLQLSWDGGADGNRFIIPFLSNVKQLLKPNGVLYMLLSSWNDPEMLANEVAQPVGLRGEQIIKRVAGRERLCVWKFCKSDV